MALSKARPARQHERVLTEFVAEFDDLKVAHTQDFAASNLTRPSSSRRAQTLYIACPPSSCHRSYPGERDFRRGSLRQRSDKTFNVTLTNLGNATATWQLGVTGGDASVAYDVSPKSVQVTAGGSAIVTVTMTASRPAALGSHQGLLEITNSGAPVAHAALYTLIK